MEILLCYRWLFIKGDVFIGEWGIFGTEVFLHYSQFFVKGNFIIDGVECRWCFVSGLCSVFKMYSSKVLVYFLKFFFS